MLKCRIRGNWKGQGLLKKLLERDAMPLGAHSLAYFPVFHTVETLSDQACRAAWYLPKIENACQRVMLPVGKPLELKIHLTNPAYMGPIDPNVTHIVRVRAGVWSLRAWLSCQTLVVWQAPEKPNASWQRWIRLFRRFGKRLVFVDAHRVKQPDGSANEFLNYTRLLWSLLPTQHREDLSQEASHRFASVLKAFLDSDKTKGQATLYGNGPSLLETLQWPRPQGLRVGCNTLVANPTLLEHLRPHWLCAVDPESHYGPSLYAHQFRQDLLMAHQQVGLRALVRLEQSFHLFQHDPDAAEWVFALPSAGDVPLTPDTQMDWTLNPAIPQWFGVMPSVMIPMALSVSSHIELVGVDGQPPEAAIEDHWAYADGAQYWPLIEARFGCHPVMYKTPAGRCYQWHAAAMTNVIGWARTVRGAVFTALTPSHLPCLSPASGAPV